METEKDKQRLTGCLKIYEAKLKINYLIKFVIIQIKSFYSMNIKIIKFQS